MRHTLLGLSLIGAMAVAAISLASGGQQALAAVDDGGQTGLQLNCQPVTNNPNLVGCTLVSPVPLNLAAGEGVEFQLTVGGATQDVTTTQTENPTFRASSSCGAGAGHCYRFSFSSPQSDSGDLQVRNVQPIGWAPPATTPVVVEHPLTAAAVQQEAPQDEGDEQTAEQGDEQGADSSTAADDEAAQPETAATQVSGVQPADWSTVASTPVAVEQPQVAATVQQDAVQDQDSTGQDVTEGEPADDDETPSDDKPPADSSNVLEEEPTGPGVVRIHNDGKTITFDEGNDGVDEEDEQYEYNATDLGGTAEEVEQSEQAMEEVENRDSDENVVMTAPDGTQTEEEQENAINIEQALAERGEPYTVCFDAVTFTTPKGRVITYEAYCTVITPGE